MKKLNALTIIPIFSVIMIICSQITVPLTFTPVPINLGTFAVFLSGAMLNKKESVLSQFIYLCLGLMGLPVFAGFGSGIGTLLGPTGGFILSYPFVALIISFLIEKFPKKFWYFVISMLVGLLICYAFGLIGFIFYSKCSLMVALATTIFPFIIFDLLKIFLASSISLRLKNIISLYT